MNMNVMSKRDIGDIMPGWFPVPQNPIVPGLAGIIRLSGLGQAATCPSLEQLQGIVDPTDPCQAVQTSGQCPAGTTANFTQSTGGAAGSSWVCTANSTPATAAAANSGAVAASTIAGIPSSYLIVGALALALLAMMGRK
jgi:hypothetical protein